MRAGLAVALLLAAAGGAGADDGSPTTLAMRDEPAAAPAPPPAGPPPPAALRIDPPAPARAGGPAFEGVRFRFDVGFGIDGGQLECDADGNCNRPPSGISSEGFDANYYDELRVYGYGDAVLASRGLVAPSLSSYLATSFRFDEPSLHSTAVPSVYDACPGSAAACSTVRDILIRSGWAETDGTLLHRKLGRLRVRAGRQFRYGPAIAHFDGLTFAYDSPVVSANLFTGTRVSLWDLDPDLLDQLGLISGGDLTLDMYRLKRVPLVLTGGLLRFDSINHFEGGLAVQWSPDVFIRASARLLDGVSASQRLEIRMRISDVTTVRAELENHTDSDWHYDLLLTRRGRDYDPGDPRRWLDFGVRRPRTFASVRAGTVLLSNIDVLIRGATGIERKQEGGGNLPDSAAYLEGGMAAEVRFRRAVSLGTSLVGRTYDRQPVQPGDLLMGDADELPAGLRNIGERRMLEAGLNARFDTGRRSLAATAELYGRVEWLQSPFIEGTKDRQARGGARCLVDVWINPRLRIKVEYDVTSAIASAPELSGIKSLRALAEGTL